MLIKLPTNKHFLSAFLTRFSPSEISFINEQYVHHILNVVIKDSIFNKLYTNLVG